MHISEMFRYEFRYLVISIFLHVSVVVTMLIAGARSTSGAEITAYREKDVLIAELKGPIEIDDDKKLATAVLKHADKIRGVILFLDSEGGKTIPAVAMGLLAHEARFVTVVAPGSRCLSACALVWLGGRTRVMSRFALIGFHASYEITEKGASESGMGNAIVGAYLRDIGLTLQQIAFVTVGKPEEMVFLTPARAHRLGLDVKILEESGNVEDPAYRILPPASVSRPSQVTKSVQSPRSGEILPRTVPQLKKDNHHIRPHEEGPAPEPRISREKVVVDRTAESGRPGPLAPSHSMPGLKPAPTAPPSGSYEDDMPSGPGRASLKAEVLSLYAKYLTYFSLLGQLPDRTAENALARLIGQRLLFFGKQLTKKAYLKRQRNFSSRWARVFSVDLQNAQHYCSHRICSIMAPVKWTLRHRRTGERRSGLTIYTLHFSRNSELLIGVSGDVLYQTTSSRTNGGKQQRKFNFQNQR